MTTCYTAQGLGNAIPLTRCQRCSNRSIAWCQQEYLCALTQRMKAQPIQYKWQQVFTWTCPIFVAMPSTLQTTFQHLFAANNLLHNRSTQPYDSASPLRFLLQIEDKLGVAWTGLGRTNNFSESFNKTFGGPHMIATRTIFLNI